MKYTIALLPSPSIVFTDVAKAQTFQAGINYKLIRVNGFSVDTHLAVENDANLLAAKEEPANASQFWRLSAMDKGYYSFSSSLTFKTVDNANQTNGNGHPVILWNKDENNSNQQCKITKNTSDNYVASYSIVICYSKQPQMRYSVVIFPVAI